MAVTVAIVIRRTEVPEAGCVRYRVRRADVTDCSSRAQIPAALATV